MRIGIDISQLAHSKTGVASFVKNLVENLILQDNGNEYVLFYSSLRQKLPQSILWDKSGKLQISNLNTKVKSVVLSQHKFPPTFLDILWNKLHIFPIEWFVGHVDIFISSDWVQPPTKAKKVTILYDLIVYTFPQETAKKIIAVQKRRLRWVKKEVDKIICISQATKKDAVRILGINEERLVVVYPG